MGNIMSALPGLPDLSEIPIEEPDDISPAAAERINEAGSLFSTGEINLTIIIILFGALSLLVFYGLIRNERVTEFILRIYVIIVLVIGTLLVVSSAYATEQIAPIVGFFGTIAGYLLGKSDNVGGANDKST